MRRTRAILAMAAVSLAALAAGCGSSSTGDSDEAKRAVEGSEVGKVGSAEEVKPITEYCGDKPVTVGIAFGFAGNTWYNVARAEFEAAAKECPTVEKVLYADGQGNAQKAISDIQSMVAQGVDALVVFPNVNSKAMLPAIRAATKRGVSVVPTVADPGGEPGEDYVDFVGPNSVNDGREMAEFMVEALDGKGNVVFLGGLPGNTQSSAEFEGVKEVFADHPDMKIVGDRIVDTDWDVAQYPKVVGGLLTKYKDIDGVISDYGSGSAAGMRAFVSAGKPLPPWTASDGNEFSCAYDKYRESSPNLEIATMSSRPWITRAALGKALAAAEGVPNDEPSILNIPLVENSLAGGELAPKCDNDLPPDFFWSSQLPRDAQMKALQ